MKKLITKTLLFILSFSAFYAIVYTLINLLLNFSFYKKDTVFLWGDSQMYQGIDINSLSKSINKKVYTCAHHGAGVYDFLKFSKQVPEQSEVIVAISKLVQIRRKQNDYNRSGLTLWGLKQLYKNNYSKDEVMNILKLNLRPRKNISESSTLYPYKDSMKIKSPLSDFEKYYEKIPDFLDDKQQLYLNGIKMLIEKKCKITFIQFPYHKKLKAVEDKSPIKIKTDNFYNKVGELFNNFKTDSIILTKHKNIFSDLSHLNVIGATDTSKKLGEKMLKSKSTTIYMVK